MFAVLDLSPLSNHFVTVLTDVLVEDEQKLEGKLVSAAYQEGK